jgi:hypothetical protein
MILSEYKITVKYNNNIRIIYKTLYIHKKILFQIMNRAWIKIIRITLLSTKMV